MTNTIEDEVRAAPSVKRADLLRLIEPPGLSPIHLQIHRNYAFELIGSVLPPFLWMARLKPIIAYGDYDDTLSFSQIDPAAVQIISLDFERYGEQSIFGWTSAIGSPADWRICGSRPRTNRCL